MNPLGMADMKKLARLARIDASEDELSAIARDFEAILGYVDQVKSISLPEEAPVAGELHNVLREDAEPHAPGVFTDILIDGSMPESEQGYLKVKRIL